MPRFRYRATDDSGQTVEGELAAPSIDVARQELLHRGWQAIELLLIEIAASSGQAAAQPFDKMSGPDAELLAVQMANVTGAGLPLSAGLRALSEEVPSHRVRLWLRAISDRIERGQSLGSVAREAEGSWPRYFLAMLQAGQRTGKLPTMLNECVVHLRTTAEVHRQMWVSMAYPAALILVAWLLLSALATWLLPQFKNIFTGFGTELPGITVAVLTWSDAMNVLGWWSLPALLVGLWVAWVASESLGYARTRDALVAHIPLFGEARRSAALGEFCRLLSLLVKYQVGLPEAIRLAAGSVRDADLRDACFELALRVEAGETLTDAATGIGRFPQDLLHLFRWADRGDDFSEGLQNASDVLSAQSRVHSHTLAVVCEPAVTIAIGTIVAMIVIALFMPLVKLLNDLS